MYGLSRRYAVTGTATEVADSLDLHYAKVGRLANRPRYKKQDLTL